MAAAFPDQQGTIEDIFAEGDRVVTRTTVRGTHTGPLRNIAAPGRSLEVAVIDIRRVADGQLAEHWGIVDNQGLMRQLGVMA